MKRDIHFKVFEQRPIGAFNLVRKQKQTMTDACRDAALWINGRSDIEVANITTTQGHFTALVTVWYYHLD